MSGETKRFQLVALMFALSTMSYLDRSAMSIAAPTIIKEFGLSSEAMGTVFSAALLGYTLLMTPSGALADRFGARLVLAISGYGAAIFTGLTALCGSIASFLGVRLAFGACMAPIYPSCGRVVTNFIPEEKRGRTQATILAGSAVGLALAPPLFSTLIESRGWRSTFLLASVATVVLTVLWHLVATGSGKQAGAPVHAVRWGMLFTNRNLLLLTLGYFFLNYFEYIFFYWMYYYVSEIRHMSPGESAWYTSAMFLTMAVMMPMGGWAADRFADRMGRRVGSRVVPVVAITLSSLLLYLGVMLNASPGITVTLLSLALGFCTAAEGPYWGSAMLAGKENAATAGGILNTGGNFGGMLAPVVTPFVATRFGWAAGLYVASGLVLIAVLVWFWVNLEEKQTA